MAEILESHSRSYPINVAERSYRLAVGTFCPTNSNYVVNIDASTLLAENEKNSDNQLGYKKEPIGEKLQTYRFQKQLDISATHPLKMPSGLFDKPLEDRAATFRLYNSPLVQFLLTQGVHQIPVQALTADKDELVKYFSTLGINSPILSLDELNIDIKTDSSVRIISKNDPYYTLFVSIDELEDSINSHLGRLNPERVHRFENEDDEPYKRFSQNPAVLDELIMLGAPGAFVKKSWDGLSIYEGMRDEVKKHKNPSDLEHIEPLERIDRFARLYERYILYTKRQPKIYEDIDTEAVERISQFCSELAGTFIRNKQSLPLAQSELSPEAYAYLESLIDITNELKPTEVNELVVWGDGDDIPKIEPGDPENPDTDKEYRFERLMEALESIGIRKDQIINIYKKDDEHLIDLKTNVGRAQILVADHRAVYVIRDENFSHDQLPLYRSPDKETENDETIDFLIERAYVWKFGMPRVHSNNLEQENLFTANLRQYVLGHREDLPIQQKHRVSWRNKGLRIEFTVAAHVIRTGFLPSTQDKTRFSYGPLSYLSDVKGATPSKANHALRRNTVNRFKTHQSIRSLSTLWHSMVEAEPELKAFERSERRYANLNVNHILRECKKIIDSYGIAPNTDYFELLEEEGVKIFGHSGQEIQVALKYGCFQGDGHYIPRDVLAANNLEDLQVQAGLARYNNQGELVPVQE